MKNDCVKGDNMAGEPNILIIRPIRISAQAGEEEEFAIALSGPSLVSVEKLREGLIEFAEEMLNVFSAVEGEGMGFALEEVELTLQITAEGRIGLLGSSIGGESMGGIKMKLRKRQSKNRKS